jgi:PAS domain S-box-containing protein
MPRDTNGAPGESGPKPLGSRKLRMKERLHFTEAVYHSLVESLPQFIIRKDLEGRLTFANQRFCDMVGKPLEKLLGKTDADLYPADLAEKYRQDDLQVIETGKTYDIEEANIVPGQDTRYVRVVKVPIRDRGGKTVGVQGIFWDVTEQKKAAQALVEQSHLLATIMDNVPDLIYFKDKHSRFTRVNRAHAAALGLQDPAAAAGKWDADFFPPEQASQTRRDEKQVMDTQEPIVGKEESVTLPDGTVKWYATTKMPFRNRSGRIIGTFGISRDITDRKRAELALLQQLELFNCLMDSLPDCVYFKDHESRFTRVNKFLVQRFGLTEASAVLGRNDFDLFTPEHARPAYEDEQEILRTGQPIVGKVEKETFPNGSVMWVSTTKMPHRDASGQIVGTFGVSRDITDWKRAEEKLAEQLGLFDCLMDSLPDCVYFKDRQSRFIRANKATLTRRRCTENAQIAGKSDADFFTEEHACKALSDEQAILRDGRPLVGMVEKETLPDGTIRWVVTSKMPLRDAEGRIVGTFGVTRDITDWKRAEEQLAEQANLLDTLMESSPDSIYFKDREGRFLWISRAMAARHGLRDPAEARGKTDFDFFPEAHARQTAAEEQEILSTGQPVLGKVEKKVLPDGSVRWSSTTKAPFRDKGGAVIGTFGITRDITDQKAGERL